MLDYTLSGIFIYPVKSLAGIRVASWDICATGFAFDRKWMLIDDQGQFLSQRRLPKMALIKTELTPTNMIFSAPQMEAIEIPTQAIGSEVISCTIWKDQCKASHISQQADEWFSAFLQQPCRLVRQLDDAIRPVDPNYAYPSDQVAFSDGFPFLIISENSLESLNTEMQLSLPMSRFRPNLVVSGCPAYAEDGWREITIGNIGFRLPKPCSRCTVPTIDPVTAQTGKEPLASLNRLRKWQNKVYFGQNALHDQCGSLTVGDTVKVKRAGEKQPPV